MSKLLPIGLILFALVAAGPTTQLAYTPGQSYQIENVGTGTLLRPQDANKADGTPLVVYPKQAWKCMTWKFQTDGDQVTLKNHFTGKTLGKTAADAAVKQSPLGENADAWKFVSVEDGVYRIESVATGEVLTATDDDTVALRKYTGDAKQKWKLLDKPAHFTG